MRPHNLTADDDRRRPAVVRLVRLQRRLDRLHRRLDRAAATDTRAVHTETGVTFLNTTLATWRRCWPGCSIERILHGKATSLGAASGIVAGLVAITPVLRRGRRRRRDRHRRDRRRRCARAPSA